MEFLSPEFFAALGAIIFIDLLLAGDNAIIIALAAKNLPADLRKRAIVWGTVGAIVIRTVMTLGVVWLLKIPGIMLIGGLTLIWIAYKLIAPPPGPDAHESVTPASNFWAAIRTIVIADAVMGIDNVLGVAGAAQGSFLLVVLGLIISIPIMIWGSQFVLTLLSRYPWVEYLGASILVFVAAKMVVTEPMVKDVLEGREAMTLVVQVAIVVAVLALAFLRRAFRQQDRLEEVIVESGLSQSAQGDRVMNRILVPVDGSDNAINALAQAIGRRGPGGELDLHLLNVRPPLRRHIGRFLPRANREAWHREKARAALEPAVKWLESRGIPFKQHIALGNPADTIVQVSRELGCDRIVMGVARKNSLQRLVEDSVTNSVLERSPVPVEIIPGAASSPFERFGIPAGVSAGLALFALTVD